MSEKIKEIRDGSFLCVNEEGKAYWGHPEGYPYKEIGTILDGTFEFIDNNGIYLHEITDEDFTIVGGKSYTVIWDGITYQCVATTFNNALILGNLHIAIPEAADTGEPFLFGIFSVDEKEIYANNTAATHTITVRGEIIHPMATEFLPDEYVTETELASKGYLTSETDPTVPAWAKAETKPSYDFSELTVNDPESAKTALAIENGMILKDLQAAMPSYAWWESITYGNGKFVAVVYKSNKAAYSNDGITWTTATLPSTEMWISVTYGNGKFVAIADDSVTAAYSEDGITWTATTMTNSERWSSVAYGNGKFVAVVYDSNKAAYSEDGITWTVATLPNTSSWKSITYGNGKFVAIPASSNKAAYSEDGITWNSSTISQGLNWMSITYGNDKFVAVATNPTIATYSKAIYSEDGITWHNTDIPSYENWYSVAYGNGKFVTVAGNSNKAAYSEDGITWTVTTMPSSEAWMSITYGNGKFVAVVANSTKVAYSEDGITWKNSIRCISQNNSNITESVRSIIGIPSYSTANNGQFLRVIDGTPTWTESLPTLTSPNGTKYQLTISDDGTLSAVVVS